MGGERGKDPASSGSGFLLWLLSEQLQTLQSLVLTFLWVFPSLHFSLSFLLPFYLCLSKPRGEGRQTVADLGALGPSAPQLHAQLGLS